MGSENHRSSAPSAAAAARERGQGVASTLAGCYASSTRPSVRSRSGTGTSASSGAGAGSGSGSGSSTLDDANKSTLDVEGGGVAAQFVVPSMGEEHFYGHMLSGALAGTTEHCAMFPLDTIKTRMQTATGSTTAVRAAAAAAASGASTSAIHRGGTEVVGGAMRDVARSLMRTEGRAAASLPGCQMAYMDHTARQRLF
jgi:hypothetical protein